MSKITEEELKTLTEQEQKKAAIVHDLGVLETQKHHLLHEIATVNEEIEQTKKQLEEEYGSININVVDGTYEEVEELEEDQPVAAI